jgi:predicted PurR-regulated permease PerM
MTFTPAQRLALAWFGVGAAIGLLLWLLSPVLAPFLLAAVLAYGLHPLVGRLSRHGVPRTLAVLLVEALALLAVAGVVLLLVPVLLREIPLLREQIPGLLQRVQAGLAPLLARLGLEITPDLTGMKTLLMQALGGNTDDLLGTALSSLRIGGSVVLAIIGNAILLPVALYYLLMDAPQLIERLRSLVPPRLREPVLGFAAECDELLGHYLRGQLLVMLTLAVYYSLALAIAGLDLALPVGVFTGLAVFIPYVGFGLGLLMALLVSLLEHGPLTALLTVGVVYGVGQLLESFVLTPRLVGERIGLSPLAVIFALLAFGHLLGFVGVLIALPASALVLVAWRRIERGYRNSRLYTS